MKKLIVLMTIVVVFVLAAVIGVSAMPHDGDPGGRTVNLGVVQPVRIERTIIICPPIKNGKSLTRQELKDLQVEMALNGKDSPAAVAAIDCMTQNMPATK